MGLRHRPPGAWQTAAKPGLSALRCGVRVCGPFCLAAERLFGALRSCSRRWLSGVLWRLEGCKRPEQQMGAVAPTASFSTRRAAHKYSTPNPKRPLSS